MNVLPLILALALASSGQTQTKPELSQLRNPDHPDELSSSLIALFNTVDLVALGEWHGSLEDQEVRLHLIHHQEFPKTVRNIVIECGNSLYQSSLDRYVDGQDVPKEEIQKVWRDTTQSPVIDDAYLSTCKTLIDDVRSLNRTLPTASKIHILAGDSPVDWSKVKTAEDFIPFLRERDEFVAQLIEREILRKGQRALIIYGAGHIWRKIALSPMPNLATILDKDYPGRLFTVLRLSGPYPDTQKLESLIPSSDRSVFIKLKGTKIGELNANEFIGRDVPVKLFPEGLGIAGVADGCVYTGKTPDTRISPTERGEEDAAWKAEKERRRSLMPHPRQ